MDTNGEQVKGGLHIFEVFKFCHQIEILDVEAHIFGPFCAYNAIPMEFGCIKVGHADRRARFICDQIVPSCNLYAIWVILLRVVIDDRITVIKFLAVAQHMFDFIVCRVKGWHLETGVCP